VHLGHVALGVVEEDLLPAAHGPGAVVRERDALLPEAPLERREVVGPERDVAALERVDGVPGAEAGPEVALR
jgi:hypothetical protein